MVKGDEQRFTSISTDSRTLSPGGLFVALKGEQFDGHQFIAQAVSRGGSGVIVDQKEVENIGLRDLRVPVVGVPDTLRSFGDLAEFWRRLYPLPVVAITGSNGKTTTKEMVASILARSWKILKNQGTFNNLVGLPITLLQLNSTHQAAVVELGMNHPGEIKRLTEIVSPDVGLITNIQPAHLQGLGTLEGIEAAKGELFAGMAASATIVVNRDDPRVLNLASSFPGRQVSFSVNGESADITLDRMLAMDVDGSRFLLKLPEETLEIDLPVLGLHHLNNAVAAAAVVWALNLPTKTIASGLANFKPVDKRMEVLTILGEITIINDSYNANPGSMAAALETLRQVKKRGRGFAVLGDMLELGDESAALHSQVGAKAVQEGVDYLLALGEQASHLLAGAAEAGMDSNRFTQARDHQEIASQVRNLMAAGDWILVKGSRGMRMEKVVEHLLAELEQQQVNV
ncbi:MAG: UDP-N-acetylmuramoyl-tripeptide--D-alanyl-D-alanine ligase [Deltaproteobacteria bacterium]|nr:UDP-N-acetylmuramoyl-tripeptide--D-alanyl-D-alanine ligase [Deltaproteobacteria bacterium]